MVLFLAACQMCGAQNAPAGKVPLDAALHSIPLPAGKALLAVDAGQILSSYDDASLPPHASPERVARHYGEITQQFGSLTVVASADLTVLSDHLDDLNPYAGLPPQEYLRFLLASLTPRQWEELTGKGLPLQELIDPTQQSLLLGLFPEAGLLVQSSAPNSRTSIPRDDCLRGTLTLTRSVSLGLSMRTPGSHMSGYIGVPFQNTDAGTDPAALEAIPPAQADPNLFAIGGTVVVATIPHKPKASQMDFEAAPMQKLVQIKDRGTVAEAVHAVSAATTLPIFVDPRYAPRPVTLVAQGGVRAGDLLQALAFGVGGCYRHVEAVWVLTDDTEGYGAKLETLKRKAALNDAARRRLLGDPAGRFSALAIPLNTQGGFPLTPNESALLGRGDADIKFEDLPAEQQAFVTQLGEKLIGNHVPLEGYPFTSASTVRLSGQPNLDLHLNNPVATVSLGAAFQPGMLFQNPSPAQTAGNTDLSVPGGLTAALAPFGQRAVLVQPKNDADIDAVLKLAARLQLNGVWWDLSDLGLAENGAAAYRLPVFVAHSLERLHQAGLAVSLSFSLSYLTPVPAEQRARDITGTDSQAYYTFQLPLTPGMAERLPRRMSERVAVDWQAPLVGEAYRRALRGITANPNIRSVVLRDSVHDYLFGENLEARADFIRRFSMDPVDIPQGWPFSGPRRTLLPSFPMSPGLSDYDEQWGRSLEASDRNFLSKLTMFLQNMGDRHFVVLRDVLHDGVVVSYAQVVPAYVRGSDQIVQLTISEDEGSAGLAAKLRAAYAAGHRTGVVIDLIPHDTYEAATHDDPGLSLAQMATVLPTR